MITHIAPDVNKLQVLHKVSVSPLSYQIYCWKHNNIFALFIISLHWDGTGSLKLSLQKTVTYFPYVFNTMAADVLATQGARTSAAMILT